MDAQVRAQDALLATERLAKFRDSKARESKNCLNRLEVTLVWHGENSDSILHQKLSPSW